MLIKLLQTTKNKLSVFLLLSISAVSIIGILNFIFVEGLQNELMGSHTFKE